MWLLADCTPHPTNPSHTFIKSISVYFDFRHTTTVALRSYLLIMASQFHQLYKIALLFIMPSQS